MAKPVYDSLPPLNEMYEEVKGKSSGATRSHRPPLNTDQFGDENLTPDQRAHYDELGEIKKRGGEPTPSQDPFAKKPKYGDQQNPLPPGGKAAIKPLVPPTPRQVMRRRITNLHKLQAMARRASGKRR